MRSIFYLSVSVLFLTLNLTSCSSDDADSDDQDYSEILANTGENIILKTYEDLQNEALNLKSLADALVVNPTSENLEATKSAWIATRSPWEQSEGFLFGPVDQEGLDPSLDSWPVNVVDLDNVLASSNPLTVEFLAQQEGTLKGFHTIEYLLWGETSDKTVDQFTTREFEYLAAASGALAQDASALYLAWSSNGGNYIENVIDAGNGSLVYVSQKSALEEITNALIIIADEVANGKINEPLAQQDLTLEESRFSNNSKADFADNMRSIKNIYTGYYASNGNGESLNEIIAEKDSELNSKVLNQIDAAISDIENIPGTFTEAVINSKTDVEKAQQSVRDLQFTLESDVLNIITNL